MANHRGILRIASALLSLLVLGACASTVPTSRSQAGREEVREQDVSDARLEAEVRLAILEKLESAGRLERLCDNANGLSIEAMFETARRKPSSPA